MSSKKVPEVVFEVMADDAYPYLHFANESDLAKYCYEHDQEMLLLTLEPMAQVSEKMKMYAFLHRVIYPCAVIGYTAQGYEGIDNVKADYMLRAEFAKDFIKKPNGEYMPIILDKRNMTKARLHKYMSDCVFFIETELQQQVPDSQEYLLNKATGRNFKKIE